MTDTLFTIHQRTLRLIDVGQDALAEPLTDAFDTSPDSPEARTVLAGAVATAKALLLALEAKYEFGMGISDLKEEDHAQTQ